MKNKVNINVIAETDLCRYKLNIGMLLNAETGSQKMNKKQIATTKLEKNMHLKKL